MRIDRFSNRVDGPGTLDCTTFGRTEFRADVAAVTVPTPVVVEGGPHGVNVSHPEEFDRALIGFLSR